MYGFKRNQFHSETCDRDAFAIVVDAVFYLLLTHIE